MHICFIELKNEPLAAVLETPDGLMEWKQAVKLKLCVRSHRSSGARWHARLQTQITITDSGVLSMHPTDADAHYCDSCCIYL